MATITTPTTPISWHPDVIFIPAREAVPSALVLSTSTVAGKVEGDAVAVRVPWVDDADAAIVAEGAVISESDPELSETVVFTAKVAQLIKISREQYVQDNAADLLNDSVRRAITRKADELYVTQAAPTSPAVTPPAGLLNVPGITTVTTPISGSLDVLVDALAVLEEEGGTPSGILAAPSAWAALRRLKVGVDSNESLLGAGTDDAERRLLDLPVTTSRAVPAGTLLVYDKTAIVAAVGDVALARSEHVFFTADSVALRATFRFGANVVRPERVAVLTVDDGETGE